MSEKKRLHPVAIFISSLQGIKDMIFPYVLVLIFNGFKGNIKTNFLLLSLLIVLLPAVFGFLKWLTFRYWMEDGELRMEYGVIIRKKRYIPLERIQSVIVSEGLWQRLFGLAKVQVETAGSNEIGKADAELTAITKEEAVKLQKEIRWKKEKGTAEDPALGEAVSQDGEPDLEHAEDEEWKTVFTMNMRELFLLAVTSGGVWGVIAALLAFAQELDDFISFQWIYREALFFIHQDILLVATFIILVFLAAYLAAIAQTMLKYAHFTVKRGKEELFISRGLLEKRQLSVPAHRVQGIMVKENIIRKLFGYATVVLVSAGSSGEDKYEVSGEIVIFPLIRKNQIGRFIRACLPEYTVEIGFRPAPKRARWRFIIKPVLVSVLPVCLAVWFFRPWGWVLLVLVPLSAWLGHLAYRHSGWNITGDQLALRSWFVTARTAYLFRHRIQSLEISVNLFQKRQNLGNIQANIKSGIGIAAGRGNNLDGGDLQKIYRWYSRTSREA